MRCKRITYGETVYRVSFACAILSARASEDQLCVITDQYIKNILIRNQNWRGWILCYVIIINCFYVCYNWIAEAYFSTPRPRTCWRRRRGLVFYIVTRIGAPVKRSRFRCFSRERRFRIENSFFFYNCYVLFHEFQKFVL